MAKAVSLEGENRFDLKRQLADTLQGRIYSATDRRTGDYCVVKETWKQLVRMKRSRDGHRVPEDFQNEKAIMAYLSSADDRHPGFVSILDEWEDDHCHFYAMEGCRGGELFEYIKNQHTRGSLQAWVTQQARLPQQALKENNVWTKAVSMMFRQLVDCVAWMHGKGVCHLDLSLENTMIHDRQRRHVKIIDFGLGRYFGNDDLIAINKQYNSDKKDAINNGNPNVKFNYKPIDIENMSFRNNQRVGKTGYMAPEVYERKEYDARAADIWSLGVMLFMMCIGAPPYEHPTNQNAAFRFIINGRLADVLKHWKRLNLVTADALDLMNKIFKPERDRIKMDEILAHPFVTLTQNPLRPTMTIPTHSKQSNKNNSDEKQNILNNNNNNNDNNGNNGGSGGNNNSNNNNNGGNNDNNNNGNDEDGDTDMTNNNNNDNKKNNGNNGSNNNNNTNYAIEQQTNSNQSNILHNVSNNVPNNRIKTTHEYATPEAKKFHSEMVKPNVTIADLRKLLDSMESTKNRLIESNARGGNDNHNNFNNNNNNHNPNPLSPQVKSDPRIISNELDGLIKEVQKKILPPLNNRINK